MQPPHFFSPGQHWPGATHAPSQQRPPLSQNVSMHCFGRGGFFGLFLRRLLRLPSDCSPPVGPVVSPDLRRFRLFFAFAAAPSAKPSRAVTPPRSALPSSRRACRREEPAAPRRRVRTSN